MIQITRIQIPTLPTEKPRRLYVCLPRDYARSGRRYPVLYMFDGHNVFYDSHATYGKSWGMKEYLERTKLPLIVVAVECNHEGARRLFEYSPWAFDCRPFGHVEGLGRLTLDWIVGTLKPQIDAQYRTLPDREHTLIAGSSMGGLMAYYALLAYNGTFSRAAALSPSLWAVKGHEAELRAMKLAQPSRIYLDCGTEEERPRDQARMLRMLFSTAASLVRAGADVAVRSVPGAQHSEAYWEKRIPVFFEYLLQK